MVVTTYTGCVPERFFIHIEHYLTQRLKHTICNRSHKNICEESQKLDYTKQ
jgi:hypothetical protein